MSLLLATGTGGITGAGALNVLQPALAASGTTQDQLTGTAALTVPQPVFAAAGTVVVNITGTAALAVPQPVLAASGTVTVSITGTGALAVTQPVLAASGTVVVNITGTGALTVPAPTFSAVGTGPASGTGGRPRRTVHEYPPRRARRVPVDELPMPVEMREGAAVLAVKLPTFRARGFVEQPGESAADDRFVMALTLEDPDVELALTLADTWLK